ncbi:hypothetical protein Ancab_027647, partial [Ancistrocladus abbreviatus]
VGTLIAKRERKQDYNMVKCGEQVTWVISCGNSRKSPGDIARPLCWFGLVSGAMGLLEACGPDPSSEFEEACGPTSQKSDNLNMLISRLKKIKNGRPKNQLIGGMGLFCKLKKSKRRASSKCKSYRMRSEASVFLSTTGGEEGASVLASSAIMKGLIPPRESNSVVPTSEAVTKGPIL